MQVSSLYHKSQARTTPLSPRWKNYLNDHSKICETRDLESGSIHIFGNRGEHPGLALFVGSPTGEVR